MRGRSRDDREAQHLFDRLGHLERLGVAQRVSPGGWRLTPGWQKQLRDLGERGDIVKQLHRAMRGGDPERFHAVRPGQGLPDGRGGVDERVMVGRVAAKGLEDESKGIWYAVLETPTGGAYHVRLSARQAEVTRTGDLVTFGTRRDAAVRPVDRHIAEVAARDGVYALADDRGREGEARSAAARLRELERLGMRHRAITRRVERASRPTRAARDAASRAAGTLPSLRAAGPPCRWTTRSVTKGPFGSTVSIGRPSPGRASAPRWSPRSSAVSRRSTHSASARTTPSASPSSAISKSGR